MLDFLMVANRDISDKRRKDVPKSIEVYPIFKINLKTQDLMIRGRDFYAVWDDEEGLWKTSEYYAQRQIDKELDKEAAKLKEECEIVRVASMWNGDSGSVDKWHKYCMKQMRDNYHQLDEKIVFANEETCREDYASIKLSYSMEHGSIDNYDELMSTLYEPEERDKLEWAIGSIISGDSKNIQKFIVLYGEAGSGKSTFLNIVQMLFEGYCATFDARSLASSNNEFALESFKSNPLIAIQHDGDLSRIEDNTKLNSIVSHEYMEINEKFKPKYNAKFNAFLFMGTNKPVKITDAKSGIIRRLIDVSPSGNKVPHSRYNHLMNGIKFELGAIADYCLNKYLDMGPEYYDRYVPINMISTTNDFYNFMDEFYADFEKDNQCTLKEAWEMYKRYCEYSHVAYPLSMRLVKSELKNYFEEYKDQVVIDGKHYRNCYIGFKTDKFVDKVEEIATEFELPDWLNMKTTNSLLDIALGECKAQVANEETGAPPRAWDRCTTNLSNIDTSMVHYVLIDDIHHIVTDFDIKDDEGNKCLDKNLKAASTWPKTYAELSKSGQGIHLHYIYKGDVNELNNIFDKDIEIKVFNGKSSLRRKLTKCNEVPIATITSGLPLKGEKKVLDFEGIKSENALRTFIANCILKKHHGSTAPEVKFMHTVLGKVYESGMQYDVTDMERDVHNFAGNSTNQSQLCLKLVNEMHFKSKDYEPKSGDDEFVSDEFCFFDVEVFPNLFVVVWKLQSGEPQTMVNPTPKEISDLCRYRLVGFNNRRYDNHILYARTQGYDEYELYKLSQRLISPGKDGFFGAAYNLSETDIYEFCSKKQSLKKWEIELGIHHQELGLRWDEPVPEELWDKVAEYCINDVVATQAVFEANKGDFIAREILAELADGTINDSTNSLTTKIIFGKEKHPKLNYVDLSETFDGYEFRDGKNLYRGINIGRGGYIISSPNIYENVALLDVTSLHPTSAIVMNAFGDYTKKFEDLVKARVCIKHGDYETPKKMFDGKLVKYLDDPSVADQLAQALKIAINSVYGLTSASFDNPFKDPRNINNIVALRGALFMKTLHDEVLSKGFEVVAVKTDSIKIVNATKEIIDFCHEFAALYGYKFEHEASYSKICQINDADYIAKYMDRETCESLYGYYPSDNKKAESKGEIWTSTGAKFSHPYVFKKLFSHDEIEFDDLCETKSVTTALYLDMNENLKEDEHDYHFIGKVGRFCAIKPGCGGGILLREKDGEYNSANGTKGYRWLESEMIINLGLEDTIDMNYYETLKKDAIKSIEEYGDFEIFAS